MLKIAVYPGSFNPWHDGHRDVLTNALTVFDKVIIAVGHNPDKPDVSQEAFDLLTTRFGGNGRIEVRLLTGFLADFTKEVQAVAVVRGLRNPTDFTYEQNQQYWNEDLGMRCPVVYFISKRNMTHMSSTMIRQVKAVRNKTNA